MSNNMIRTQCIQKIIFAIIAVSLAGQSVWNGRGRGWVSSSPLNE